jgi:hypothetical protein
MKIDDHYLKFPKDGWGHTDVNNEDMVNAFKVVNEIVRPKNVIEIGMFAGHGTLLMFNIFDQIESITSYDPSDVSAQNARQIRKYHNHTFYKEPIWGNEHRHSNVDLVFVDGNHTGNAPSKDMKSASIIKPRYVLVDNIEHDAVRITTKREYKLWDVKYDPQYYFYTNEKYSSVTQRVLRSPGIMGLFKMEGNYEH